MSATLAPQGLVPTRHPSGTIRVENRVDGIASGYSSNIFTGTPVMNAGDGTLAVSAGAPAPVLGVFQGCEFSASTKRFVLPYFPAGQTYEAGSMIAKFTGDPDIIFEGQCSGPVLAADMGAGINIAAVSGSTYTGFSTQALSAPVGATAASFKIIGLAGYDDNRWGDLFTKVLVQIATLQPLVAMDAGVLTAEQEEARNDQLARDEELNARQAEDSKLGADRIAEDKARIKARKEEDDQRAAARAAAEAAKAEAAADPNAPKTY